MFRPAAEYNWVAVSYLEWLQQSLTRALGSKSIGVPVAMRATLQLHRDHGLLLPAAASGLSLAEGWFESTVSRVYTQGGPQLGYVAILAELAAGQTAIVVSELIREAATPVPEIPRADLWMLGNHGSLRFHHDPGADGVEREMTLLDTPRVRALQALIEDSRRSGEPAVWR